MLNIGAEVNIVNQRFAIECNFKTLDVELPTYSWLNKTQVYCYKAYKVLLRIKDSWGKYYPRYAGIKEGPTSYRL